MDKHLGAAAVSSNDGQKYFVEGLFTAIFVRFLLHHPGLGCSKRLAGN